MAHKVKQCRPFHWTPPPGWVTCWQLLWLPVRNYLYPFHLTIQSSLRYPHATLTLSLSLFLCSAVPYPDHTTLYKIMSLSPQALLSPQPMTLWHLLSLLLSTTWSATSSRLQVAFFVFVLYPALGTEHDTIRAQQVLVEQVNSKCPQAAKFVRFQHSHILSNFISTHFF